MKKDFFKKPIKLIKNFQFLGQNYYGVGLSPYIIANSFKKIPQVSSYDFPFIPKDLNSYEKRMICMEQNFLTYECNKNSFENAERLINLGGDHSIATGSIKASLDKYGDELHVIWIDAHADANTRDESLSGNVHGMPVNMLLNICKNNVDWLKENPLNPHQITYIGLRDLDQYEHGLLHYLNIEHYSMRDMVTLPLNYVLSMLKNKYGRRKIHISIDVDAIDPVWMPSTGTPVDNGLSVDEVTGIINTFGEQIVNADIVELNLELGDEYDKRRSFDATISIMNSLIRNYTLKN